MQLDSTPVGPTYNHISYTFRLYPTPSQEERLYANCGARRFVWNWALQRINEHYESTKKTLRWQALCKEYTVLKHQPGYEWLNTYRTRIAQAAIRDLDQAFQDFFRGISRRPRFKSKRRGPFTFRVTQLLRIHSEKIYVPGVGQVKIKQSRPMIGPHTSATFHKDAAGRWYVVLIVERTVPPPAPVHPDDVVGVDVGVTDIAVTSDGERFSAPRYYRRAERKLKKSQRDYSRKQKGSSNQKKARRRLARLSARVAQQRHDFTHKLSTSLTRNHAALSVETLSVAGMTRTKLSKSVHDASLSELLRQVRYKSAWLGKPLAQIDMWFPSSKTCSACGEVNHDLTLSMRTWTCECGELHDRDINAAKNIRVEGVKIIVAAGYAETRNDCGGDVSPGLSGQTPVKQEPTS